MAIEVNDGFGFNTPRYADLRAGKLEAGRSVPYASVAAALAAIPAAYRCEGLQFRVKENGFLRTYEFNENHQTSTGYQLSGQRDFLLTANGTITIPANTVIEAIAITQGTAMTVTFQGLITDWNIDDVRYLMFTRYYPEATTINVTGIISNLGFKIFYK